MENKLELKHLAAYLPFGLEVLIDYGHSSSIANLTQNGITKHDLYSLQMGKMRILDLRPLSDLAKEIEVNGEKFIPKDKLFMGDKSWINFKRTMSKNGLHCEPQWLIQQLCEWHFDVFGLIEKGLAIDINTI